ncbi:hypothetical protein ACQ4LE_010963 [Meloidogyne hapla]
MTECKLTKLDSFLNLESPRKNLKRKRNENNFIENFVIEGRRREVVTKKPHINFCIEFEEIGNYYARLTYLNQIKIDYSGRKNSFLFFVNPVRNGEEKCINHLFNEMDEEEKEIMENMRAGIMITIENSRFDKREGYQYVDDRLSTTTIIAKIQPLFDENYEYKHNLNESNIKKLNSNDKDND